MGIKPEESHPEQRQKLQRHLSCDRFRHNRSLPLQGHTAPRITEELAECCFYRNCSFQQKQPSRQQQSKLRVHQTSENS